MSTWRVVIRTKPNSLFVLRAVVDGCVVQSSVNSMTTEKNLGYADDFQNIISVLCFELYNRQKRH